MNILYKYLCIKMNEKKNIIRINCMKKYKVADIRHFDDIYGLKLTSTLFYRFISVIIMYHELQIPHSNAPDSFNELFK